MRVAYAVFNSDEGRFMGANDSDLLPTREQAMEFCDLLNNCEIGSFQVGRVKLVKPFSVAN